MRNKGFFLAVGIAVVLLSQLTGAGIVPGPDIAGLLLAFCSLFLIPGIIVSIWVFGSVEATIEGCCRIFFGGLVYALTASSAGFIPGTGLKDISIFSSAVTVAALVVTYLHKKRMDNNKSEIGIKFMSGKDPEITEHKAMAVILFLMFIFCFILFFETGELGIGTDALDHLSFIRRSLDTDTIMPSDSYFIEGDGSSFDPRKGMWHPVMALWTMQADTVPEYLWIMIPSFLVLFMLAAFWVFAKEILGSTFLTIVAGFFLVIFVRGEGLEWFTRTAYSKNLTQGVLWISFASVLKYMRTVERKHIVFASMLALMGTAMHPVFAMWMVSLMTGLLVYRWAWERGAVGKVFLRGAVPVAAALAVPLIIRFEATGGEPNWIHMHPQGLMILGNNLVTVDPAEIIANAGLVTFFAVITAPVVFFLADRKKAGRLSGTLFYIPVLLLANPLTAAFLESKLGYLHYRLLYAAPVMCVLSLTVTSLLRFIFAGRSRGEGKKVPLGEWAARWCVSAALILIFILFPLRFALRDTAADLRDILETRNTGIPRVHALFDDLLGGIPEHSVVASDPVTSYMISAFTDNFVLVTLGQHGSPTDPGAGERLVNTRDLFSPAVPMSRSVDWLRSSGAQYVLVNTKLEPDQDFFNTVPAREIPLSLEKFRSCGRFLDEIAEDDGLILFSFIPDSSAEKSRRCDAALSRPIPCRGSGAAATALAEGEGVVLERFVMHKNIVSGGDTVSGMLCWSVRKIPAFGLPFEYTIRMDTSFPHGTFYRPWYDKQYRRTVERQRGEFFRHTVTERIRSGMTYPDQWNQGSALRQDFRFRIPPEMSPGKYEIRLSLRRAAYIPTRTLADYFRNEDSFHGSLVATVVVVENDRESAGRERQAGE